MKMLNKFLIFLILTPLSVLFLSCNGNVLNLLKKEVSSADNIKIYFYDKNTGKMPNSGSVVSINDKEEVEHFLSTITEEDFVRRPECNYNGLIEFFKGASSLKNLEFNMEQNCGFVIFQVKDVVGTKKLSGEGIRLLNFYYEKIAN